MDELEKEIVMTKKEMVECTESNLYVSLKEYIDIKIAAIEKDIAFARIDMERRLEVMNKFRDENKNLTATFVPYVMYEAKHEKVMADIQNLEKFRAVIDSKASQTASNINTALSIIAIVITLMGLFYELVK